MKDGYSLTREELTFSIYVFVKYLAPLVYLSTDQVHCTCSRQGKNILDTKKSTKLSNLSTKYKLQNNISEKDQKLWI